MLIYEKLFRLFNELSKILNKQHLRDTYYALVHSVLSYGLSIWGGTYKTNTEQLLITQKYFIRLITRQKRLAPSAPLFSELAIPNIRQLYCMAACRALSQIREDLKSTKI